MATEVSVHGVTKTNQSGHLFCYLFCDCIEQLLKAGADMNTTDDNNR